EAHAEVAGLDGRSPAHEVLRPPPRRVAPAGDLVQVCDEHVRMGRFGIHGRETSGARGPDAPVPFDPRSGITNPESSRAAGRGSFRSTPRAARSASRW